MLARTVCCGFNDWPNHGQSLVEVDPGVAIQPGTRSPELQVNTIPSGPISLRSIIRGGAESKVRVFPAYDMVPAVRRSALCDPLKGYRVTGPARCRQRGTSMPG